MFQVPLTGQARRGVIIIAGFGQMQVIGVLTRTYQRRLLETQATRSKVRKITRSESGVCEHIF
jgi:hypothetical protein